MDALKSCPFCGHPEPERDGARICCPGCGAEGPSADDPDLLPSSFGNSARVHWPRHLWDLRYGVGSDDEGYECPWCGAAERAQERDLDDTGVLNSMLCSCCGAKGPIEGPRITWWTREKSPEDEPRTEEDDGTQSLFVHGLDDVARLVGAPPGAVNRWYRSRLLGEGRRAYQPDGPVRLRKAAIEKARKLNQERLARKTSDHLRANFTIFTVYGLDT